MAEADGELLRTGSAELGLALTADQLERLGRYAGALRRWNPRARLIADRDLHRLEARHLLDSLSALTWLPPVGRIDPPALLDFGSGGGLPGIPLAIARPELSITLVERQQRKARFLERVRRDLELGNVTVHGAELATLARPPAGFAVAVSRAVAEPVALWRLLAPFLAPGGCVLAFTRVQHPVEPMAVAPADAAATDAAFTALRAQSRWVSVPGLVEPHQLLRIEQPVGAA